MLVSPIPNTHPPNLNVCRCEMHLLPHWFMSVEKSRCRYLVPAHSTWLSSWMAAGQDPVGHSQAQGFCLLLPDQRTPGSVSVPSLPEEERDAGAESNHSGLLRWRRQIQAAQPNFSGSCQAAGAQDTAEAQHGAQSNIQAVLAQACLHPPCWHCQGAARHSPHCSTNRSHSNR